MKNENKDKEREEPFATIPQDAIYSSELDDLDIRLLLHFYGTYRMKGEDGGAFTYSVPALHALFPSWSKRTYRRKVEIYVDAGVLKLARYKTFRSKKTPLYSFNPNKVKLLCGPHRPHSKTENEPTLCGPHRPHSKDELRYAVPTDHISSKLEGTGKGRYKVNTNNVKSDFVENAGGSSLVASEPAVLKDDNKITAECISADSDFNLSASTPIKEISQECFDSFFNDSVGVVEDVVQTPETNKTNNPMNENKMTPACISASSPIKGSILAPLAIPPHSARPPFHEKETADFFDMTEEEVARVDAKMKENDRKACTAVFQPRTQS